MPPKERYSQTGQKLSIHQESQLIDIHQGAIQRYTRLRKRYPEKGVEWCFDAAMAWGNNMIEQKARRKAHGTGAT